MAMQAVILCAGKGTRMGNLAQEIPKPLLQVGGQTLTHHKLEALPDIVDEVVLVIGHLGERIREQMGFKYKNKKITYVEDRTLTGTAHALWQAKAVLRDRFLVMMGDDLYSRQTILDCAQHDFSVACIKTRREEPGHRLLLDEDGHPLEFVTYKMYLSLREDGGQVFTGLYSLTPEIFKHEPVKLELKNEWGLPNTLLKRIPREKIRIIETDFWLPVGTPEELSVAQKYFKTKTMQPRLTMRDGA